VSRNNNAKYLWLSLCLTQRSVAKISAKYASSRFNKTDYWIDSEAAWPTERLRLLFSWFLQQDADKVSTYFCTQLNLLCLWPFLKVQRLCFRVAIVSREHVLHWLAARTVALRNYFQSSGQNAQIMIHEQEEILNSTETQHNIQGTISSMMLSCDSR
jgi:hypothetical protein